MRLTCIEYKGGQILTGANISAGSENVQHVFIIGAKSIGQYGGYETFVDFLIGEHENDKTIKYHVACKANGEGRGCRRSAQKTQSIRLGAADEFNPQSCGRDRIGRAHLLLRGD